MDQIKIGKFIALCRKKQNLTQMQLSEKLGVTDRAVSKWENGKSLPDASIMLDLCKELKITVNELLSGEELSMKDYSEKAEQNLIEMKRQKEEADKRLLTMEIVIGVIATVAMLSFIFIATFIEMEVYLRIILIALGFIIFAIATAFAIRIEQKAGYYECAECHHRYVPKYKSVLFAMHVNRTRYMKCPHCGKRTWQKKVLTKEDEN